MKYYRVFIDFKNFISIDETELDKALRAMAFDGKAFFNEGATEKIHAVIPDYHKMMGFNEGYILTPEDSGLISRSKKCQEAKNLLASVREEISGRWKPSELQNDTKILAEKMRITS